MRQHITDTADIEYRGITLRFEYLAGSVVFRTPSGNGGVRLQTDPFSPSGAVQRMKNYIDRLPAVLDDINHRIEKASKDAVSMREQAKQPFQQSADLEKGTHNHDGTGYGLVHIEANHGKQIRNAGFDGVEEFVAHVAKDFKQVWQATSRQVLVAYRDNDQHMMYLQLEPAKDEAGDYYRVNSAFPVRQKDYPERHGFKKL